MSLSPNTTLAHYTIMSKIGAGGMGEVYCARDSRLDRQVAIKLLPSEVSSDSDRLKRFEQEARATSALNHPNILTWLITTFRTMVDVCVSKIQSGSGKWSEGEDSIQLVLGSKTP